MTWLPYQQLIEVKLWADHDLCKAIVCNFRELNEHDRDLMIQILDHLHTVDCIFQHHLEGKPHSFHAPRSDKMPDLAVLTDGIREVDDWYAGYVSGLASETFEEPLAFTFTSGKPARMTRAQILLHVCLHGSYHRGNAGALLQLKGLVPGRDGITDYLETAA
jgi:uncharacterized damage-inducible protein DinB